MKRIGYLLLVIIFFLSFCSCAITEKGESLHSFTERINKLNSNYNLTSTGYIYENSNKSLTKFFRFNQDELMLRFKLNQKNELKKEIIILNKALVKNDKACKFIIDLLNSFIHDEKTQNSLLPKIDLKKLSCETSYTTKQFKYGNTILMIDVTDYYIYITALKNNL